MSKQEQISAFLNELIVIRNLAEGVNPFAPESQATSLALLKIDGQLKKLVKLSDTLRRGEFATLVKKADISGSHKTGELSSSVSKERIEDVLGFKAGKGDPSKVKYEWNFTVNGKPFSIWDYNGARWSTYGDIAVLKKLFGENNVKEY